MNEDRIVKFTPSQEKAIAEIEAFMKVPVSDDLDTRVLVLSGPAGSGKTTIIKYALESYLKKDRNLDPNKSTYDLFQNPNVAGVALAHQAKKNLQKSIRICKTFASFFGMKETHGAEGQRIFEIDKFQQRSALCKSPLKVAVHDEASMYDKEMVRIVLDESHHRSKIIFMGDAAQLPPINTEGDEDSPVFTNFRNQIELVERVRQAADNPILRLSDIVREEIFGSQNIGRVLDAMRDEELVDGVGFTSIARKDFLKHYRSITSNYMEAKVICYRRNTVELYNQGTRNFLYSKPDEMYIENEIIYMNDTYFNESGGPQVTTLAEFENTTTQDVKQYFVYNSEEFRIKKVEKGKLEGVAVYKLFLDVEGRPDFHNIENPFIPVVSPSGHEAYKKEFFRRKSNALNAEPQHRQSKWKYFYNFKNLFADCSYAYALTGHKAQGSGYKYIYVDVNDILSVGPISNKRKLQAIYTGMTRATDLVIFLKKN